MTTEIGVILGSMALVELIANPIVGIVTDMYRELDRAGPIHSGPPCGEGGTT